ncbi:MAG: TadE/TadG family type IV pilus assembly protein [Candidatus Kryptoniota bacterium]
MCCHRLNRASQHGQSLLEFAVGAVILLLLLAGIVDLGRAFFVFIALRDAAQEGAVYGSVCPQDVNAIIQHVKSSSNSPVDLANDPNVVIRCKFVTTGGERDCGGTVPDPGNLIKIRVTYQNFPLIMPFMSTIAGSQKISITAEIQDTILRKEVCH